MGNRDAFESRVDALRAELNGKGIQIDYDSAKNLIRFSFLIPFSLREYDLTALLEVIEHAIPIGDVPLGDLFTKGKADINVRVDRVDNGLYMLRVSTPDRSVLGLVEELGDKWDLSDDIKGLVGIKDAVALWTRSQKKGVPHK